MNDAVAMAVFERARDLSRKLPCRAFPKSAMGDDVIKHLSSVDILKHHVIMIGMNDHLAHATDERMMQKQLQAALANGTNLLGLILGVRLLQIRRRWLQRLGLAWCRCCRRRRRVAIGLCILFSFLRRFLCGMMSSGDRGMPRDDLDGDLLAIGHLHA